MAEYWVRSSQTDVDQGPYRGSQLKAMVAAGSIRPDWLISQDRATWHKAKQVKGLFPSSAAAPATAPARVAVAASPKPTRQAPPAEPVEELPVGSPFPGDEETEVPPVEAPPLGAMEYYTPGSANVAGMVPPSTAVVYSFYAAAAILFLSWVIIFIGAFTQKPLIVFGGFAGLVVSDIVGAVLWLVWVYQAHVAVRLLSGGAHSVSPGTAVGFSFIPLFSGFWVVYMPYKLAGQINRAAGRTVAPAGGILALQIASVVCAIPLCGLIGIFYAVSMGLIQKGFKRLSA